MFSTAILSVTKAWAQKILIPPSFSNFEYMFSQAASPRFQTKYELKRITPDLYKSYSFNCPIPTKQQWADNRNSPDPFQGVMISTLPLPLPPSLIITPWMGLGAFLVDNLIGQGEGSLLFWIQRSNSDRCLIIGTRWRHSVVLTPREGKGRDKVKAVCCFDMLLY